MSSTVLVVEDTELLRRIYADRLQQDGYRVLHAADGLEALSLLRTDSCDLVLLDLIMPKMSGIEVLEVMKRDPRLGSVPVLVLSNLGQDNEVRRCLDLGALDFLVKNDARPADVARKISSILKSVTPVAERVARYRLHINDREGDADTFVEAALLPRRFWCPACEVQLALELVPQVTRPGWYESHFLCPACGREY